MDDMKTCRRCGEIKLLSDFYKTTGYKCKSCAIKESTKNRIGYVPLHERDVLSRLKNLCTKAKLRTKEFALTPDDLRIVWDKQNGRCAYTKLPLLATANQFNTMSLDRVDNNVGYVVGNIQLVCTVINKMKLNHTEDQFINLCKLVAQNVSKQTT